MNTALHVEPKSIGPYFKPPARPYALGTRFVCLLLLSISMPTLAQLPAIGEALDCTNVLWTNGPYGKFMQTWTIGSQTFSSLIDPGVSNCFWFVEQDVAHAGSAALQSPPAQGYYSPTIRTTLTGPANLSFWWKIQPADPSAALLLIVDNAPSFTTDTTNWVQNSISLPPGTHSLEWRFVPNNSTNQPIAWLDDVVYSTEDLTPIIREDPLDKFVMPGGSATFHVAAEGYPTLRYQWQHNAQDVPGAILETLTILNAQSSATGDYTVIVANDYGSITSSVATLTIGDSPAKVRPLSRPYVFAVAGGDAAIHSGAYGSGTLTYHWRFNGRSLPSETNDVLFLHNVTTNQAGRYSVAVTNSLGGSIGPDIYLVLTKISSVIHISIDGLSGKYLAGGLRAEPGRYPNFLRLLNEGSCTFNARCDYTHSLTVPNHLCMLTGRPVLQPEGQPNTVHHGYTYDWSNAGQTIHNGGNTNVPYKASVFDVVHDHGFQTALMVSKSTLAVCAESYNATNGAPDLLPPDNGRSKIDAVLVTDSYSPVIVDAFLPGLTNSPNTYSFLHFSDLDVVGHFSEGWGSSEWFDALQQVDSQLGRIFATIDNSPSHRVFFETAIIVTADHGGYGETHINPVLEYDYTIPVCVWAPGFPGGTDLYTRFVNRADPGTNYLDYNAIWQPLRNGDTGNLALSMLGLPPIPGSRLIPSFPTFTPSLAIQCTNQLLTVEWSTAALDFTLEITADLTPTPTWLPITTGIQTNSLTYTYTIPQPTAPTFLRLRKSSNP